MVVTGCSRHLPQLEVLQSGHDVLDVTILLTYFLPQLKSTWTSGNLSNVSVRSFYLRNYLPAAIFAENRCLAKCTRTSWSVPVIRDRGRWRSCSFPAGHTHEPVSRSRLSPVSSWRWKKKIQAGSEERFSSVTPATFTSSLTASIRCVPLFWTCSNSLSCLAEHLPCAVPLMFSFLILSFTFTIHCHFTGICGIEIPQHPFIFLHSNWHLWFWGKLESPVRDWWRHTPAARVAAACEMRNDVRIFKNYFSYFSFPARQTVSSTRLFYFWMNYHLKKKNKREKK